MPVPDDPEDLPVPENDPVMAMMLEPKNTVAGRGTRELNPKKFNPREKSEFDKSDAKEFNAWLDKGAVEEISPSGGGEHLPGSHSARTCSSCTH